MIYILIIYKKRFPIFTKKIFSNFVHIIIKAIINDNSNFFRLKIKFYIIILLNIIKYSICIYKIVFNLLDYL